ncbi:MAG: type II secretion system protein [Candidatus Paceibacterota bacterium]
MFYKKLNFKKGFTLIELLIVVSIIGILAAIVLTSLGSGKNKGQDSSIKSNLANMRGQAELLAATHGGYGVDSTPTAFTLGACANTADTLFADPTIWAQVSEAMKNSGGLESCMSTATSWSIGIQLKEKPNTEAWCVDGAGSSKKLTLDGSPTQAELNALITNGTIALCD